MRVDRCDVHQNTSNRYCHECFVCGIFKSFNNKSGHISITQDQCYGQHIIEQLLDRNYTIKCGNPTGHLIMIHIEPPNNLEKS